jgi:glycosyltransferase involved in cell wall biosynthesis
MSGSLRTVLIFAHECAPYHRPESTVGAQRPAQFAKHLPKFGWRAVVICRDASRAGSARWDRMTDVEDEARRRVADAGHETSVVVPTPSLPWDGLLDRAWRRMAPEGGGSRLTQLARKPLTVAKLMTGDYSQNWQPCARAAARAVAGVVPVDACIGEHSPDAGLFLARWFSQTYGVPWVADFRDPILQPLKPLLRRLYAPVARRLVSTATHTVAVTPVWADLDCELFGKPATSVPNGFDPEEYPDAPSATRCEPFVVVYVGNIIRNQELSIFLDGLALARETLGSDGGRLRFVYRGLVAEHVRRLVREAGVDELSDVGDYIPRTEALRAQKSADCLLLLSIARPESEDIYLRRGLYPAKAFEYLGAGRPVLCVPGDGGVLDDLVEETQMGMVLRTPQAIADFLASAVRGRREGREIAYRPVAHAVARYTREALAGRFAAILDAVVGHVAAEPALEPSETATGGAA